MNKLGFIGLGVMGKHMSSNLLEEKNELFVYTRGEIPNGLIEKGAIVCSNAKEVAQNADIIFIIVQDTLNVQSVLFDELGIANGLSSGKIVVDMSSISPISTKEFAKKIEELNCKYLDAPVSGGEKGAKNATLSIMVGGEENTFNKVLPYFKQMGKNITLIGKNGDGQTTKIVNQIIVALNLEAISEAFVFAKKAGVDPSKVRDAIMGGSASSKVLEVHGEKMLNRNFEPGFRIELHQKDLNLALSSAKELGISLPNTATVQELFNSCKAHGEEKLDNSAIIKALERLNNIEI